jgi:hypothetical protein
MVMFIKKLNEVVLANRALVMHIKLAHKLLYPTRQATTILLLFSRLAAHNSHSPLPAEQNQGDS